jgi:hypothetical protein
MLILMNGGEDLQWSGGDVAAIFAAVVPAMQLPGSGDGKKDKNGCEQAAEVKMNFTPELHGFSLLENVMGWKHYANQLCCHSAAAHSVAKQGGRSFEKIALPGDERVL